MTDDVWLPPKAFAAVQGVSLRTVRRWLARLRAGERIPGVEARRIGGRTVLRVAPDAPIGPSGTLCHLHTRASPTHDRSMSTSPRRFALSPARRQQLPPDLRLRVYELEADLVDAGLTDVIDQVNQVIGDPGVEVTTASFRGVVEAVADIARMGTTPELRELLVRAAIASNYVTGCDVPPDLPLRRGRA